MNEVVNDLMKLQPLSDNSGGYAVMLGLMPVAKLSPLDENAWEEEDIRGRKIRHPNLEEGVEAIKLALVTRN